MEKLVVSELTKRFERVVALDQVSLAIAPGEVFCVVGPTNAGKSTLLKCIAGLHRLDSGSIVMDGRRVERLAAHERHVSLLFQNMALFPNLTAYENIAFPLRAAGEPTAEIERKVKDVSELLRIGHLLNRRPSTYSGGEQQRVAIGRALVARAELLMLDEPLTNLDARLRIELRVELKKLHGELGQTIVYVTHDQVEAMSLSDRIAVLNAGTIQQIGSPDDVYHRPENRFVAEFIGTPPMNIVDVQLSRNDDRIDAAWSGGSVGMAQHYSTVLEKVTLQGQPALGIRPEDVVVRGAKSWEAPFPADVMWVEALGSKSVISLKAGERTLKAIVAPNDACQRQRVAWVGFPEHAIHILDSGTGRFLRPQ